MERLARSQRGHGSDKLQPEETRCNSGREGEAAEEGGSPPPPQKKQVNMGS